MKIKHNSLFDKVVSIIFMILLFILTVVFVCWSYEKVFEGGF